MISKGKELLERRCTIQTQLNILNRKLDGMERNIESDDDLIDESELLKEVEAKEMELKQVKEEYENQQREALSQYKKRIAPLFEKIHLMKRLGQKIPFLSYEKKPNIFFWNFDYDCSYNHSAAPLEIVEAIIEKAVREFIQKKNIQIRQRDDGYFYIVEILDCRACLLKHLPKHFTYEKAQTHALEILLGETTINA